MRSADPRGPAPKLKKVCVTRFDLVWSNSFGNGGAVAMTSRGRDPYRFRKKARGRVSPLARPEQRAREAGYAARLNLTIDLPRELARNDTVAYYGIRLVESLYLSLSVHDLGTLRRQLEKHIRP